MLVTVVNRTNFLRFIQIRFGHRRHHVAGCGGEYDVIGERHAHHGDVPMASSGAQLGGMVAVSTLSDAGRCRRQRDHLRGTDAGKVASDHPVQLPDVACHL